MAENTLDMMAIDVKGPPEKLDPSPQQCGAEQARPEFAQCQQPEPPQMVGIGPSFLPKMTTNPAVSLPMASGMVTSSSQRDTQTRLISSSVMRASQGKDEYLLRLLGKGGKPPLPISGPSPSSGFRVPDPVPPRAAQVQTRPSPGSGGATDTPAGEKGSAPGGFTATASEQLASEVAPGWSYADTKRRMGSDSAGALRTAVVAHQVAFLEQLYDLHRAIAVQKLLVRNCPEVKPLMAEAARILMSTSSGQRETRPAPVLVPPPAKRARLEEACPDARTTEDDEEPGLRPDSQFAAVPLPGETAGTGDGSGDDGDGSGPNGSGGNGSGGGSNSPQLLPQLPIAPVPPRRMPILQAAPSGASQTPIMFPHRAQLMAPAWYPPVLPMQMPPGMYGGGPQPGLPGGMDPAAAGQGVDGLGGAGPPQILSVPPPMQYFPQMPQVNPMGQLGAQVPQRGSLGGLAPVPAGGGGGGGSGPSAAGTGGPSGGGDPMAWWYQTYYGRPQTMQQMPQMQQMPGMGGAPPGVGMPPPPMQAQHAQQMATAAALTAFGPQRWWQDCNATFGPPADLQVIAAGRKAGNGPGEAESAPPSTTRSGAVKQSNNPTAQMAAPPVPRRSKRKPSDPIEEASSGTTGQDHHLGPHAVADDAHFKSRSPRPPRTVPAINTKPGAADTSAARLLLSMSGKGVV